MEKDDKASILTVSQSRRTFTLKSIVRRDDRRRGDVETGKGPIGLTTVFEPSDPADSIVDVVFVHGLNGGSNSTWSQNSDPALFWPKEWLGKDDAFKDARIHTFGYNSSFTQESVLNINDFATSLLVSIKDCPTIPRDDWVPPIILIGHSMGGLVIKKAFVISNQRKEFQSISERVLTMFFLATPHRGSDSAAVLSRLLSMSGARPFVGELHRNSPTIESINEEFPRFCGRLSLFSFFETQPMNYGIGKGLIVDKESAVLNYSNETTTYLAANHRNVAKFSSPSDPAYISIRNALATTIDLLRDHRKSTRQKLDEEQRQALSAFLGVSDAPENTLSELISSHLEGSCEWFLQKDSFRRWRDSSCSQMLWVQGKPGIGKSVLAGHIVDDMRRSEVPKDCCFYFFTHSDKPKCTIASFLLSMAWQMAAMHVEVHDIIHRSLKLWTSEKIGTVDHNPIWRRLFLGGILKAKLNKTQFWVVDGLDECKDGLELVNFLVKVQELWPMSILITSRNPFDPTSLSQPQTNVLFEHLHEDETKQDIALFVQSQIHAVPARDQADRDEMAQAIVEKSMGCFLWVQLVMSQLRSVHTIADVQRVLSSVPSDMNELYRRILDSLSQESHGKHLAKSILRWAACSSRPLTTSELRAALEIDLNDVIPDVEKAVDAYCGHLVYFESDTQSSEATEPRMRFVHSTAKEFLTNKAVESDFVIDKAAGHKSLASACLKYLSGSEARPLKHRRIGVGRNIEEHAPFMDYASTSVFEHVAAAGRESVGLCSQLITFLSSPNVLHWVEHLADQSELSRLLQAGTVIGQLLKQSNMADIAGISRDMKALSSWSTDLVRLVSKFGKQLQSHPYAIHSLIPPFCPHDSAIYRRFTSPRGLHLVGLSSQAKGWDDCSSIITYPRGETITAAACSERYFALGTMLSKSIIVYDEMTCQETRRLSNEEAVMMIRFGVSGKYLASAGPRSVKIWDLTSWKLISNIPTTLKCMSLEFVEDDKLLLMAMKNNMLVYWDVANDDFVDEVRWSLDPDAREAYDARSPVTSVFSVHQGLLAISYRAQDLLVWSLDREMVHDVYCRESGSRLDMPSTQKKKESILSLTFSAAPGSHALIAGYMDGELVLYDTSQGTLRHRVPGVNAQCLSSSPDGRTLATGDALGTIQLFDLESLKFLYRINFDAQFIAVRALAFTSDGHRLLDVRGKQCRVWEPVELLRPERDETGSDALSVSVSAHEVDFEGPMEIVYITSVVSIQHASSVLCGKDDGSVHIYDSIRGEHRQELYRLGAAISFLLFDEKSSILICADQSSRVLCSRLVIHPQREWRSESVVELRAPGAITQILGNKGLTRVLVCTQQRCLLYSLDSHSTEPISEVKWEEEWACFSWSRHPNSDDLLVLFRDGQAYTYQWETLAPCIPRQDPGDAGISPVEHRQLGTTLCGLMPSAQAILVKMIPNSDYYVTTCEDPQLAECRTQVHLWKNASLEVGQSEAEPVSKFAPLSNVIDHVLGAYNGRLVFLKADGWICSVSLNDVDADDITSHFFIPADWLSLNNQIRMDLTLGGDVIFVKRSELAIIKRGLEPERKSITTRSSSLAGQSGRVNPSRASSLSGASGAKGLSTLSGIAERPRLNTSSRWKSVS